MNTENFTIKADWIERMDKLCPEQRSLIITAIYNYFVYGKLSDNAYINFATSWIRDQIGRMKRASERRRKRLEEKKRLAMEQTKADEQQMPANPEPATETVSEPKPQTGPEPEPETKPANEPRIVTLDTSAHKPVETPEESGPIPKPVPKTNLSATATEQDSGLTSSA